MDLDFGQSILILESEQNHFPQQTDTDCYIITLFFIKSKALFTRNRLVLLPNYVSS